MKISNRFSHIFNLSQEQAIALLDTPQDQLGEEDSRYVAAAHLVNFPTDEAIAALIRALHDTTPGLDNRIVRRKSVETLGRLKAQSAIPAIQVCLQDEDPYTVENAAWAIGELAVQDPEVLETVASVLERPEQTYRVAIHTLAAVGYQPALERIQRFITSEHGPTASAAIAAVYRLTGDSSLMHQVVEFLQDSDRVTRRSAIQDLMDARWYDAIPAISRCPESLVFRLRAIRLLADIGVPQGAIRLEDVQPYLEQTLLDHPSSLELVHEYDQTPTLIFLIRELYDTDFGRCYLATQTLIEQYPQEAPAALLETYAEEAHVDYGAHYHVMKLLGWLKYSPAYDLLLEALHNTEPQFQKSRAAAALSLGELGNLDAVPHLQTCLTSSIWDLKYAALMALQKLGHRPELPLSEQDWMIKAKAQQHCS